MSFQPPLPSLGAPRAEDPLADPPAAWPAWMAPAALAGGLVLASLAGLIVDIPALALGVKVTGSHVPGGLEIADTVAQDLAFLAIAVFFAQLGGRAVSAWQFGLRPPVRLWRASWLVLITLVGFLIFSVIWTAALHSEKEKLLEQLGAGESTLLLLLSAALTCVIAPICEEFLFRGFIFTALRNWRGTWPAAIITGLVFGGVHAGSAPVVDLVPLAGLGFGLCLLYRYTGSLYPGIAVHSLNNSLAFGGLEGWGWQILLLMAAALALIWLLALALIRAGVISAQPPSIAAEPWPVGPAG
jgi:membrane protease YdiL (CAAX protease family)